MRDLNLPFQGHSLPVSGRWGWRGAGVPRLFITHSSYPCISLGWSLVNCNFGVGPPEGCRAEKEPEGLAGWSQLGNNR